MKKKIDKVSDTILNNKKEINSKLELILLKLQKSNIKDKIKENNNKTEEENSDESEELNQILK